MVFAYRKDSQFERHFLIDFFLGSWQNVLDMLNDVGYLYIRLSSSCYSLRIARSFINPSFPCEAGVFFGGGRS